MQEGDTPEEIHEGFPTVTLAQINTIIDWYLNNQMVADEHLREYEAEGERIRQEIESQPGYMLLREKLQRYREQRLKT
jgi:hypothetical protein